jgi:hypothetical protein
MRNDPSFYQSAVLLELGLNYIDLSQSNVQPAIGRQAANQPILHQKRSNVMSLARLNCDGSATRQALAPRPIAKPAKDPCLVAE